MSAVSRVRLLVLFCVGDGDDDDIYIYSINMSVRMNINAGEVVYGPRLQLYA